ncbi:MAG TPA: 4Fe-4S dicluster domain-containing protein, partial [Gemmatimonadales bacterium]|nr:4Fe-4S dicluster domain-containing protein [Gemmatimonadales bacterium]
KVPNSVHLGLFRNETGSATTWQVPAAHYLESWADGRALDGTASLVQPLIAPLYNGLTAGELLAMIAGEATPDPHRMLRDGWRDVGGSDFTAFWDQAVQKGVIPDTSESSVAVSPRWGAVPGMSATQVVADDTVALIFSPDAKVYDGRFGDNPWLQELPDPLTKLTWDNAALLSPGTASTLGVESGQIIEIASDGRRVALPALILPGHADGCVTLPLGYGRHAGAEPVAEGCGFDVYRIRSANAPWVAAGTLRRLQEYHPLALTQAHWAMEGRPIVLSATLDQFRHDPEFTRDEKGPVLSLYQPYVYRGEQWGMAIDLGLCTGCSACVVACQAENNIPVVGKEGVQDSREMHWIRIDRYYSGDPGSPGLVTQPMLCQHCEKAPCEYVCPVNATVHSPDGINEMVYNRCVGTRFCSNNCPYKVRRFNWFDYNAEVSETEAMAKNPDVTVRSRGVMEKCTFCIQRVREAQLAAAVEGRQLGSDEVHTACQQACPTEAIVFGSLGDPQSAVSRRLDNPRAYQVLHELGTRPRVHYLARIRNANRALEPSDGG